ncbi:Hypothetical predicted protein [Paramuricea clavata]|uniref:Uncharacterized protein n=1 Tax=Paramuricea clavata TaxID=317549 RepID=A0A7D9M4H9_PARCT|nr:Hypothetical predicted protein [Paramuricea clavata]
MYEVLEAIYVFFNASTKHSKVCGELVDSLKEVENALQLRNLSKTRWTVHPESVEALWRSFKTAVEALRALNCTSENTDPDTKTKGKASDTCPDNSREIPVTPVLHPKYQPSDSVTIVCYHKKLSSKLYGENCRLHY